MAVKLCMLKLAEAEVSASVCILQNNVSTFSDLMLLKDEMVVLMEKALW